MMRVKDRMAVRYSRFCELYGRWRLLTNCVRYRSRPLHPSSA